MPSSLLARTFLLIATLVLLTTVAWFSLFRHAEAEPRAREAAQLTASAVNLVRAALIASAPERRQRLFTELSSREGIRLLPAEHGDRVEPLPNHRFLTLVSQEISTRLGPHTRVALSVNDLPGFWVSFRLEDDDEEEEYWLILPRERASRDTTTSWLTWGLLALGLALGVAWWIASRISRPLAAMARAAESLGRGQSPDPLAETGADEVRQVASAFNRMTSDLARHEKERSEVLAGISHDLRTPLTRLRLEVEMSIADAGVRDAVSADIEQMDTVIAQFMEYARGDQGETPVVLDPLPLLEAQAQRHLALGRALHCALPGLPPLPLRRAALSRAVNNLLENAYKYGGDGPVELAAQATADHLCIEVRDRGPGIPESEVERLKRPFTRLESARSNAGGTGLGLAIVDRVARLHGGQLDLLPRPEGGLIARLSLPRGVTGPLSR